MNLTNAHRIAAEIESIRSETLSFIEFQLKRLYSLANTPGEQAAILEVLDTDGVSQLTAYAAFKSALDVVKPDNSAQAVALDVFQPQPDGSVIYVAPPQPDPQPEPSEEP